MSLGITITLDGNCREAVTFYAEAFEQEVPPFLTYADYNPPSPDFQVSEKMKPRVKSAVLAIAGSSVEFCDASDAFGFVCGNDLQLTATYENPKQAKRVFDRLSKDAYVDSSFQQTQQGQYCGMLVDQFDIAWVIKASPKDI